MFVSRAGEKLAFALEKFNVSPKGLVVADFGSSTGGFVDCNLQNGAKKVYAVETGYGVLDWKLRNDPRVVVMERTNAMHVTLPEKVDLITVDTSWTKQKNILPNAKSNLKDNGIIISLIKPHYEADAKFLRKGKLLEEKTQEVINQVLDGVKNLGFKVEGITESPILGEKGKNKEFLVMLSPA
jgi:23S rRNA (cytidine1920-2'-O)/16S rRNA (cytidine1409-2'-O)-methyltransferase